MKKWPLVLGLVTAIITLGWFWLERSTRPADDGAAPVSVLVAPGKSAPVPTLSGTSTTTTDAPITTATTPVVTGPNPDEAPETPTTTSATPTAGDILAEPDEDLVRVAKKLSVLVRDTQAPMAEREEALAHALNLSAGNEAEVLTPLVTDPAVPDPFAETILAEALNRPLAFQADLYLAALAARKSPEMQTLIREHLAFLTGGEDLGANPAAWVAALNTAKKDWE